MKEWLILFTTLFISSTALIQEHTLNNKETEIKKDNLDSQDTKVNKEIIMGRVGDETMSVREGFTMTNRGEGCAKSRQKRTVNLPNRSALSIRSRLVIPQNPVGLYLVLFRVRFFVRVMFTDDLR